MSNSSARLTLFARACTWLPQERSLSNGTCSARTGRMATASASVSLYASSSRWRWITRSHPSKPVLRAITKISFRGRWESEPVERRTLYDDNAVVHVREHTVSVLLQ